MTMFRVIAKHGENPKLSRCLAATRSVHLQIRRYVTYVVKVINKLRGWLLKNKLQLYTTTK